MPPPRLHPLAHSRTAERAGGAIAALWRLGIPKPPLEPDFLWKVGSRRYTSDDEVSIRSPEVVADFRDRLDALCRSLREEARLNALGHTMAYGQLTAAIRKRHALGRLWREHPELAKTPIAPPIVVVGQMRAGTTRLHRLLAADPRHSGTRFCNSHHPVPTNPDWRPIRSAAALAIARQINPWLDTLHPFGPRRADEEIGWLAAALSACTYEAQYCIPSFVGFSEARDGRPVYREFARILRTDAAAMRDADRPRVLKCPQFAEELGELLTQFPEARVVVARRASADTLLSTVSMVASQTAFQTDHASLDTIQREWRRKLELRESRIERALANFSGPVAEIDYDDLGADWGGAIARIYRALDLKLTPAALAAMTAEQGRAAKSPHRAHREALRRFADA